MGLTHEEREILRPLLARYAQWPDSHDGPVFEGIEAIVAARVASAAAENAVLRSRCPELVGNGGLLHATPRGRGVRLLAWRQGRRVGFRMTGQSSPSPETGTTRWHLSPDGLRVHPNHLDCCPETLRTPVLVLPLDGLREQIARAIYGFEVGPFGPNSVEIFAKGGTVHLNGSEADHLADAVLAVLAGFAAGQETT